MRKNRPKKPKSAPFTPPSKQPRARPPEESSQEKPSWRFSRIECVDDFGAWHNLTENQVHAIREKLSHFETMTWHEILVQSKKQNHSVCVNQLVSKARQRLAQLKLDDTDELVSLHLSGKQRIYGIRERGTLLLLWWDPDHEIYPIEKKRT